MTENNGNFSMEPCRSFDQFISKATKLINPERSWVFRGQKNKELLLSSTFERACDQFKIPPKERYELEEKMIREFQRLLHLYITHVPEHTMTDEWLAMMQHYGAPTRLLDFTYSPYVAAFFAFETTKLGDQTTIWAIDTFWLDEQIKKQNPQIHETYLRYDKDRNGKDFDTIFRYTPPHKLVLAVAPFRRNERIAYQKGIFLCPGSVQSGFMDNLSIFEKEKGYKDHIIQYVIDIDREDTRNKALRKLELMNINRNTLFPGLEGFAQSFLVKMVTLFSFIQITPP